MQSRLRTWLVSGQIALALVLLANAGLLLRSFVRLSSEQPGFDSNNVQTIRFSLPQTGYDDVATIARFYDQLHSRATAINGIKSDALISILPLAPKSISFVHFTRPDRPPARPEDTPSTNYRIVTPDYFRTMGIPLLDGRNLTESDDAEHPPVAIVSESFALRYFGGDAVGRHVTIAFPDSPAFWIPRSRGGRLTVVGVAREVREDGIPDSWKREWFLPICDCELSIQKSLAPSSASASACRTISS